MHRREFFSQSAAWLTATAALQLTGCQLKPALPETADWQQLRQGFKGQLLFPADPLFSRFAKAANSRFDAIQPALIARPVHASDVQLVLAFAWQFQLPLVGRCGGHNYAGYSSTQGVLLDFALMDQIELQGETAWIGAGAKLGDVYFQLSQQGRSIPAGSCVGVGISGLTLGGGMGMADRKYGLTCDALLEAELVTATGELLRCSAQQNSELFWGLRGGGGGQFGLVTRLKFRTFATAEVLSCHAYFQFEQALPVLNLWQHWSRQLPRELWSQAAFWWTDDQSKAPVLQIRVSSLGATKELQQQWATWLRRLPSQPFEQDVVLHDYAEYMLSDCAGLEMQQCKLPHQSEQGVLRRVAMAGSSDFFQGPLPKAGLDALLDAVQQRQQQGHGGGILLTLMGGAIRDLAHNDSAFAHRAADFCTQYLVSRPVGTAEQELQQADLWMGQMRLTMAPWSTGGAYLNYTDPLLSNWPQAYYADHYPRLQRLKKQYDPEGMLRFAQKIKED
ncbi:FAD-binding oxidoreductase [Rheinheimera marina]|uniref:FAD-binding oxidoreductase n=1 Tax=Rheinheimera marina TaxID=1774958 RepID=A0ABV9JJN5_9GAMM